MPKYIAPAPLGESFTCPFCDTTSTQYWYVNNIAYPAKTEAGSALYEIGSSERCVSSNEELRKWGFAECSHCHKMSVWRDGEMVYPESCPVGEPNEDMPARVREIYLEAANVFGKSPRASSALLRLALQHLLGEILEDRSTGGVFTDIDAISSDPATPRPIVKALDIVRICGNESVHPGTINLNDDPDTAALLFVLLNMVTEHFFSQPKRLNEAYGKIPEGKRIIKEEDDE